MAEPENAEAKVEAPPKKKSKLRIVLLILLLLAAAGGGVAYKLLVLDVAANGDDVEESAGPAAPVYVELRPAFVINLADTDTSRFLQLEVDLMSRLVDAPLFIEQHMPAIRHQVVMELSSRGYSDLRSLEGKQLALDSIRDRINLILLDNTDQVDVIEEVYFSSFVMQ